MTVLLVVIYVPGRSVCNFTSCLVFCRSVNQHIRDQTRGLRNETLHILFTSLSVADAYYVFKCSMGLCSKLSFLMQF